MCGHPPNPAVGALAGFFRPYMRLSARAPTSVLLVPITFYVLSMSLPFSNTCISYFSRLRRTALLCHVDVDQLSLTALQGLGLRWQHRPHAVAEHRARAYYAGAAAAGTFVCFVMRCELCTSAVFSPHRFLFSRVSSRVRLFASLDASFYASP